MNIKSKRLRVLITGGSGYLANAIISKLSATDNFEITVLSSRLQYCQRLYQGLSFVDVQGNNSIFSSEDLLPNIDIVILCAFARGFRGGANIVSSLVFARDLFRILIQRCDASIINISSQGVYDQSVEPLWDEDSPVGPSDNYGMAKYATELLLEESMMYSCTSRNYANLRIGSLTGPGEGLVPEVVSKFVWQSISGSPIKIVGGEQRFQYIDVRDAADGIVQFITNGPVHWKTVYNLGNNDTYGIVEIAKLVTAANPDLSALHVDVQVEQRDIRQNVGMDSMRFYRETNWVPAHNMQSTIVGLYDYLAQKEKFAR